MSYQGELRSYIARIRQRLQLRAGVRGMAIFFATALLTTLVLVLLLNHYAFPHAGAVQARFVLLAVLVVTACAGIAWPLWKMTATRAIASVEAAHPDLEDRLTTFHQREEVSNAFVELLAADTLTRTAHVEPQTFVSASTLAMFAGAGAACIAVLLWMIFAAPGYVGYGASLLWRGERKAVQPLYAIAVQPGDVTVRRNSDQLITAEVTNLHPERVELFARFHSSNGWEPVAMQAIPSATGNASYQFTFTGLPEDVEYYVTAGPLTSEHHTVRVADLAAVKSVKVTYHYPAWTGLKTETQEHAGDLRAIEGTQAELQIEMDRPLKDGNLSLDDGRTIHLEPVEGNRYKGTIAMAKDGAYHVAGTADGKPVRLSEDYFIATDKAEPPQIAIEKPGRDYRASPIEEVTIGVKGGAQFGLRDMHLHYSVNGGPDKDIAMLSKPGAHDADGKYTLRLEDFKLQPGDLVSLYATARDGHAESRTDISFIQADPFEREFSQSQQGGGGGGGGQQGSNQTDISRRQKELIEQTWKQINDKTATEKSAKAQGDFLSGAQIKLRDQVNALSVRVNSRDLSEANEEFTTFDKAMQEAAKNMLPASEKLSVTKWQDALVSEQKALQALLRAEATFRQIQVAFGPQGGGGGGGGSSTGRDLASLFDLELDTEKNQYETARTSSPQEEHQKQVEDALAKLDALAKRQEELAQQQKNPQQAFQERWQQEMLRREAEQLQRQMEQLAQNNQNGQQGSSQSGPQGQSSSQGGQQGSQQSAQGSSSSSGSNGQQQDRGGSNGSQSSTDQRIEQALNRVRSASDAMKRAGAPGSNSSSAEAQQQAAQRLREATGLLGGAQQNLAGNRMGQLSREADRIQQEEKAQAQRIDDFTKQTQNRDFNTQNIQNFMRQRNQIASDRQELSDSLSKLQKNMREAASGMSANQPDAAKKVRDALSEMDNSDLDNRMQRSADWLRRGVNPNSNGTEKGIADGLSKLSQQLHAASGAVGNGNGQRPQDAGKSDPTAALGQVARLRSELQAMQASRQGNDLNRGSGQQGNDSQSRRGQQGQGQGSQQTGSGQQSGSQQGGGTQSAQNGGGQNGNAQTAGNRNGGALTRGNGRDGATDDRGGQMGDLGNRVNGGGGGRGTVFGGANTGNNTYAAGGTPFGAKDTSDNPADTERNFQQSLRQLQALRGMVRDDPQAQKDLAELTRQMQNLDPKRFPGNPAMVEQMHSEVLRTVDRLELELQRSGDTTAHTGTPQTIPAGYSDSVADYYRRLSKNSSR